MSQVIASAVLATVPSAAPGSTNGWNWSEIARLVIDDGSVKLTLGPYAIALCIFSMFVWALWRWKFSKLSLRGYDVVEAELSIANIGKVTLRPNDETARIAYQAWVELSTRKVGLAFNENDDVIAEVYSSWYEAFGRLRDLAKSIPARQIQSSADTRKLVEIMIRVLNDGLRPHLTTWQARFRRWYASESGRPENGATSPQEIQKRFPQYRALVDDLTSVQGEIVEYREFLWKIAEGKRGT
jgi:hypothetical protein